MSGEGRASNAATANKKHFEQVRRRRGRPPGAIGRACQRSIHVVLAGLGCLSVAEQSLLLPLLPLLPLLLPELSCCRTALPDCHAVLPRRCTRMWVLTPLPSWVRQSSF